MCGWKNHYTVILQVFVAFTCIAHRRKNPTRDPKKLEKMVKSSHFRHILACIFPIHPLQ